MGKTELAATEQAATDEAPREALVGHVLGGVYRVVRFIGQGGMGAVYEVERDGERAAAKVLAKGAHRPDKTLVKRFAREASAAADIDSPFVAKTYELSHDADLGAPFLLMELLEGKDLAQLLQAHGALAPPVAVRLTIQAAEGLAAAHARGIVHRDVKPANLFVHEGSDGAIRVKVCDFGIAKLTEDRALEASDLTKSGGLVGSPLYMSPEQAQSARDLDARTDVWSLSVSLYEALSGKRLFREHSGLGEIIVAICTKPIAPLSLVAPWIDPTLAEIVQRGLRIDRAERWPSMRELADALAPFAADEPLTLDDVAAISVSEREKRPALPSRREATSTTVATTASRRAQASTEADRVASSTHPSSGRGLRSGAVVVAGLSLAAVGYTVFSSGSPPRPEKPETVAEAAPASAVASTSDSRPPSIIASSPISPRASAPVVDSAIVADGSSAPPAAPTTTATERRASPASAPKVASAPGSRPSAPPAATDPQLPTREEWK